MRTAHRITAAAWPPVVPGVSRRRFLHSPGSVPRRPRPPASPAAPAAASVRGSSAAAKALPKGWSGTIADVKHVVILMQENRSFDHYFGTLRGVRGFGDKQALTYQNGTSVFQQPDAARTDLGLPAPLQPHRPDRRRPRPRWDGDHEAWNGGLWNNWVAAKTEETMGYFTRDEIPFQYAVADAFTICDGYHQAIMAPTSPNRMYFWTGTSSRLDQQPGRLQGRLRARRRDARGHDLPRAAAEGRDQLAGVHQRPGRRQRQLPRLTSWATSATTRSGSTSSTTPPTAATAGPASSRPAARSRRGRPTRGRRR